MDRLFRVSESCLVEKALLMGPLGSSAGWASDFGSGHDLAVREFEPCVGLCADSSEPGACFGFCVSLSLFLCPAPDRKSTRLNSSH